MPFNDLRLESRTSDALSFGSGEGLGFFTEKASVSPISTILFPVIVTSFIHAVKILCGDVKVASSLGVK